MTREEIIEGLKLLEDNMVYFDELLNDKGEYIDVHELLFEAIEVLEQESCEDCISRKEALRIAELGAKEGLLWQQMQLSILPSVQPISKFVIEDIKADIAEFMAKIPTLGNCKEGWHNAGQRIGLEQACEIIDNHIAESEK